MASSQHIFDVLVEWDFAVYDSGTETTTTTTYRYAMNDEVVIGPDTYEQRVLDVGNLEAIYIDRTTENFGDVSITFDNMPDTVTGIGPFSALNEIDDFEDKRIRIYIWDGTTKHLIWWGLTTRPSFDNSDEQTCSIGATFPWNAIDIQFPRVRPIHRCPWAFKGSPTETTDQTPSLGCKNWDGVTGNLTACNKAYDDASGVGGCVQHGNTRDFGGFRKIAPVLKDQVNNLVDREKVRSSVIPLVYGIDNFKIRPENTQARIVDDELLITAMISGTAQGHPFVGDEITADRCKIFDQQRATDVIFLTGLDNPTVPASLDRFPDGAGHPNLAMISARFDLTQEQKDALEQDGVKFHAMSVRMLNGRPLARTGLPDDNPQYILEDMLRDGLYGIRLNPADVDVAVLNDAATYLGGRFQFRIEQDTQKGLKEFLKEYFGATAGYITFEDGMIQFGCKRDDETGIAIFGTGGRQIDDFDQIEPEEKDFSQILNSLTFKMRTKNRQAMDLTLYDKAAQIKAGNTIEKEVEENVFIPGVYDPTQGLIAAAIMMREQLNQDYYITFRVPLYDGIDIPAGRVIRVNSPYILNNDSNYLFRVIGKSFDLGEEPTVTFRCQVYKQAVYAYNYDPIGGDILRGPDDTTFYTRPPDVENTALEIVDKIRVTDPDDQELQTTLDVIKCSWTYPDESAFDTEDEGEGIAHDQSRIIAVDLWWRYNDESEHTIRRGARINYPFTEGLIQVDHDPTRTAHVTFVSVAPNYGTGKIGYVMDPTKTTAITADITNATLVIPVDDVAVFTIGQLAKIGNELVVPTAIGASDITVAADGGFRKTELDTVARSYDAGTEIGSAIWSHPYETIALGTGRYNYPPVTGVFCRRRRRGVRVGWTDVDKENTESYFVLWADDEADLEVVAEPGLWNPAWYTGQKPWESLPVGISFKRVKELKYTIPYEDIGDGENPSEIFVRVFAKNRRRYSSSISEPAQEFHGNGPLYEPRAPAFGADHIVVNQLIPGTNRVEMVIRVRFDKDLSTRTAGEAEVTHGGIKFQRYDKVSGAWLAGVQKWEAVEDFDQEYVDIRLTAHVGSRIRINRCLTRNDGRVVRKSTVTDITFRAGAETDDILGITNFQIDAVLPVDAKHSEIRGSWTNGQVEGADTLNVALRRIELWEHEVGVTDPNDAGYWHIESVDKIRDNPDFQGTGTPPGSYDFFYTTTAKHKKNTNYEYKLRLYAVGSNAYIETAAVADVSDNEAGDLPITTAPSYPYIGHIERNHIVGDPAEGTVELVIRAYAEDGIITFATSLIRTVTCVISDIATGERFRKSVTVDPTATYAEFGFRVKAGREYNYEKLIYENNADRIERLSSGITIVGGSHVIDTFTPTTSYTGSHSFDANDASQSTSFSISVGTPVLVSNRLSRVPVTITQRSVRPVLLKKIILESSVTGVDGGTYRRGTPETILDEAGYYSAAGVTRTLQFEVRHPAGTGIVVNSRATAIPYGSNIGSPALNKQASNTGAGGTPENEAPPNPGTAATAPIFVKGTIGNGGLSVRFKPDPADAVRPYFKGIRIQIADSFSTNGATSRDWLNVEDGSIAATATPNSDPNATAGLAAATFLTGTGRLHVGELRKKDLNNTFKSGTQHGALTLYCRAQVIDEDDTGAIRYGTWSTFSVSNDVDFNSSTDRDHSAPVKNRHVGRVNLLEGFGCWVGANAFPGGITINADGTGGLGTANDLGKEFRYGRGASARLISTYLNLYPQPASGGFKYTAGRQGIYWDKGNRAIEMYGNAPVTGTQINTTIHAQIFTNTVLWFAVAMRSDANRTFANGMTLGIWDRGNNNWLNGGGLVTGSFDLTATWKIAVFRIGISGSPSAAGPVLLSISPGGWGALATSVPMYFTEGIMIVGPEPRTLFEPGVQEARLVPSTGVTKTDNGTAALKNVGGTGADGISTWGFLDLG